jgi:hypothetical protein
MQVAVDQAAQASPSGNLARKVRTVFQGTEDAVLVKEHQAMLKRYRIQLYSAAVERHGEQACNDEQVCTSGSLDSFFCISVARVLSAFCEADRFV